jgi:putative peptidoglycan lipid II flippase
LKGGRQSHDAAANDDKIKFEIHSGPVLYAPACLHPYNERVSKVVPRSGGAAIFVAAGILVSRLAGLVRRRIFAHYLGLSDEADAFDAGFRIPNFLQNLFGEGALSASFIPVYSSLVARGNRREADRVAGAVASLLSLVIAVLVLAGVAATPLLIDVIAPGFDGAKRELTIQIVRVLFPGAGLLVLSAWCLGVLNSHGRFLLSYAAPVVWNAAMIATLIIFGRSPLEDLAVMLAWGSVAGSALQIAVQVPSVLRAAPDLKFALDAASDHVRTVLRNFLPAFISRGVVQISAFIDNVIASLLGTGAVAAVTNAQLLYTLPVSLFGMSVSAAELPSMSAIGGDPRSAEMLRERLNAGLRRIAVFVTPSAIAFIALGDVVAAALFQTETGRFTRADATYVWAILAGSGIALLPSTLGRLYSSAYYALQDTRTPLRYALARVGLSTALGYVFAVPLPRTLGVPQMWGAAGLTFASGIAGWVEMMMLRSTLNRRVGRTGLNASFITKLGFAAIAGAGAAWLVKSAISPMHPFVEGLLILTPYGIVYFGAVTLMGIPEATGMVSRLIKRR